MDHVHASAAFEQLGGEMLGGTNARRAEIELARIGLGVGDQLGDGFHRQGRIYHQHVGLHRNQGDRCEILQRIVADGAVEADVHGHRRAGHRQRVAVGLGLGHGLETDVAAGAGTILDDDGLAEVFSQLLPHNAGHDVDAAARREGHHELDRFGRVVLSLHCRTEQEKKTYADRAQSFPHVTHPILIRSAVCGC